MYVTTTRRAILQQRLQAWRAWCARADVRAAFIATVLLRLVTSLNAALLVALAPDLYRSHLRFPATHGLLSWPAAYLTQPWARWDTNWYLGIAHSGYLAYKSIAFMPLYPLLIRIGAAALGGHFMTAALLISTIATFGALLCLYRLAEQFSPLPNAARWTVVVAALLPISFFLVAGYTEALFLWATLAALLAFLRGQWVRLAGLAVIATLTRQQGAFLSVLLIPTFLSTLIIWLRGGSLRQTWRPFAQTLRGPALAAIAGPATYLAWGAFASLALQRPTPWDVLSDKNGWNLHFALPGTGLLADLHVLALTPPRLSLSAPSAALDAAATILCTVALVAASRRFPPAILLYLVICWLAAIVKVEPDGLPISAARYLLSLLPLAMLPGEWLARGHLARRLIWIALGVVALCWVTTLFFLWTWID